MRFSKEQAEAKAKAVKTENNCTKRFIAELKKLTSNPDFKKFDGKQLNKRVYTFIEKNTSLRAYKGTFNDFTISYYDADARMTIKEDMVYNFFTYGSKPSECRAYCEEADNFSDRIFLMNDDATINIDAWIKLIDSYALYNTNKVKERKKFEKADTVFKAYEREEKIQEQIRALEKKKDNARPFWLNNLK